MMYYADIGGAGLGITYAI